MKKLLLILLLPIFSFGQFVNTFPWVHDFENFIPLQQDTNDFGDWLLHQGSTSSIATGPSSDHTTGNGVYFYVESSGQNYGGKVFTIYTPTFDVSPAQFVPAGIFVILGAGNVQFLFAL